jgi:hypothetical protein
MYNAWSSGSRSSFRGPLFGSLAYVVKHRNCCYTLNILNEVHRGRVIRKFHFDSPAVLFYFMQYLHVLFKSDMSFEATFLIELYPQLEIN